MWDCYVACIFIKTGFVLLQVSGWCWKICLDSENQASLVLLSGTLQIVQIWAVWPFRCSNSNSQTRNITPQQTAEVNAFDYSNHLSGRKICRWACPSQFFPFLPSFLPSSEALLEATTTQTFVHCPLPSQLLFLCFNAIATAVAHPKEFTLQFVPSPFPVLLLCEASTVEDSSSRSDFYLSKLYFWKNTAINMCTSTARFCHETLQKFMKLNCQNLSCGKNATNPIYAALFISI